MKKTQGKKIKRGDQGGWDLARKRKEKLRKKKLRGERLYRKQAWGGKKKEVVTT